MRIIDENILKGLLINPKNGPRGQIISDCPWCGKKHHFYINKGISRRFNRTVYHGYDCKRCGVSGGAYTFLAKVNALYLLQGEQIDHNKLNKFDFDNQHDETEDFSQYIVEDKKLPIGSRDLKQGSPEYQYLQQRKFTDIDFQLYEPKTTKLKSKLKDYVIIPIYQDFQIKGYVSRYVGNDPIKLRYINSQGTDFASLLGGFDEINNKTNTLILVEGFFDKVSVTTELGLHHIDELKCCCTFGKKISLYQIWLLLNKTSVRNIILMYDARDAVNDMKRISYDLSQFFNVQIADTGYDKDPGMLNKSEFEEIFNNLRTPSQFWMNKIQKKKF